MSRSTKLTLSNPHHSRSAKIIRDTGTDEYVVKHYFMGRHIVEGDYFTTDMIDAVGTAKVWINFDQQGADTTKINGVN